MNGEAHFFLFFKEEKKMIVEEIHTPHKQAERKRCS